MKCESCSVNIEEPGLCDECEAEASYTHACVRELYKNEY